MAQLICEMVVTYKCQWEIGLQTIFVWREGLSGKDQNNLEGNSVTAWSHQKSQILGLATHCTLYQGGLEIKSRTWEIIAQADEHQRGGSERRSACPTWTQAARLVLGRWRGHNPCLILLLNTDKLVQLPLPLLFKVAWMKVARLLIKSCRFVNALPSWLRRDFRENSNQVFGSW